MRGTCVGAGSSRPGGREAATVAVAASGPRSTTASNNVVVAGAGIVGASTAWFLMTEHDRPVLLLDATHPAASASGKAGGFLAATWSDGLATQELSRKGFSLHQTWSKQPEFADVDYRFGIDAVSGALGAVSDYRYIGADRRACGQVHPRKLTNALVDGLVARGGEVRSDTMLYEVLTEEAGSSGRKVVGVRVGHAEGGDEEVIDTETCVLALGAWTGVTMKSACEGVVMGPDIVGQKVHSVVVRDVRVAERQASTSLFLHDGRGAEPEAYPRPDGTVYVCGNQGGRSYDALPPRLASAVGVEEDGSCEYLREVSAVVLETNASDVEVLEAQACYLPVSSSSRPVVSAVPGVAGLYVAAGHSCWGILQGPVSGKACAELIATGSSTCVDLKPFTL